MKVKNNQWGEDLAREFYHYIFAQYPVFQNGAMNMLVEATRKYNFCEVKKAKCCAIIMFMIMT
jgi:hypothetical protein